MIYGSIKDKNMITLIKMVDILRVFPAVNNANYPMQPVYEKDLGEAYFQVLLNENFAKDKNYILSGKSALTLIDILKIISGLLGKMCFFSVPLPIVYCGSLILYLISLGKIDYREHVQRLVEPRVFSLDDERSDFGYSPMTFKEDITGEINEY